MKTVDELVSFSSMHVPSGIEIFNVSSYTEPELRALANCVSKLRENARILEIGTWAGRSASLYFQLQQELNLDIHLVDSWELVNLLHQNPDKGMDTFVRVISTHFNYIPFTYHKMTSKHLGGLWRESINFLHIDGDHYLEGINHDCNVFLPFVVSGGMVAFHDCVDGNGHPWPPVANAIENFIASSWEHLETVERVMTWRKP